MSIRLINTETLRMEMFMGDNVPPYAILSHRWVNNEEISLQQYEAMLANPQDDGNRRKSGYRKILKTCERAQAETPKLWYAWVDTCCIDKSSSAELQEATNSMYKWYERSAICYAFLADLPSHVDIETALPLCRWFTRGWCLQELIAPCALIFLNRNWNAVGGRHELKATISRVTRVDEKVLEDSRTSFNLPIARRMSWAAMRNTTRVEDQAYCLLGLFGVSMPMLYGEGEKAFFRLQEEIIKRSSDMSIFLNSSTLGVSSSGDMRHDVTKMYRARKNSHMIGEVRPDSSGIDQNSEDDMDTESETDEAEMERIRGSQETPYRNLFAPSPKAYLQSYDVCFTERLPVRIVPSLYLTDNGQSDGESQVRNRSHRRPGIARETEFTVTQKGVRFVVDRIHSLYPKKGCPYYLLGMNCRKSRFGHKHHQTYMVLKKVGANVFVRVRHCVLRIAGLSSPEVDIRTDEEFNLAILVLSTIDPAVVPSLDAKDHHAIRFELRDVFGAQVNTELLPTPKSLWESHSDHFLTLGQIFQGYVTFNAERLGPEQHHHRYMSRKPEPTPAQRTGPGDAWVHVICGLGVFEEDGEVPSGTYPWVAMMQRAVAARPSSVPKLDSWNHLPWGQQSTYMKGIRNLTISGPKENPRWTVQPVKDFQRSEVRTSDTNFFATVTSEVVVVHGRKRPEHVVRVWAQSRPVHGTKGDR